MVVKEIIRRNGDRYEVLIDDEDEALYDSYIWHVDPRRCTPYVLGRKRKSEDRRKKILHRVLLDPPRHLDVDHINNSGLDNRRCNLRACTRSENNMNCSSVTNGSSTYKGVYFAKHAKKWCASVHINYKKMHIGYFVNEVDAAKAYNVAAKELFGEFANLNIIE